MRLGVPDTPSVVDDLYGILLSEGFEVLRSQGWNWWPPTSPSRRGPRSWGPRRRSADLGRPRSLVDWLESRRHVEVHRSSGLGGSPRSHGDRRTGPRLRGLVCRDTPWRGGERRCQRPVDRGEPRGVGNAVHASAPGLRQCLIGGLPPPFSRCSFRSGLLSRPRRWSDCRLLRIGMTADHASDARQAVDTVASW